MRLVRPPPSSPAVVELVHEGAVGDGECGAGDRQSQLGRGELIDIAIVRIADIEIAGRVPRESATVGRDIVNDDLGGLGVRLT